VASNTDDTGDMTETPGHGVVVRARNGDVIRYDPSGLVMRLSDKVIADIALRMGAQVTTANSATATAAPTARHDPHDALEGIDAWDLRAEGDWLHFTARLQGKQGIRAFRRHVEGGAIIADTPGPLMGILGIGGPRAALASPGVTGFPQHIVAPADDIGAVGHAGVERGIETDRLEHLRERTHEALVAEVLLDWQVAKYAALPLFMTRVETDSAADARALANGLAFDNLILAGRNLKSAAEAMGKRAKLVAICLDFALEDQGGDALAYRDGILALMAKAERELWQLGMDKPVFVARFESGTADAAANAALEGQWELAWNHGDHDLRYSAPGYMFALDDHDRPTEDARTQMAEMTAAAISDDAWQCPMLMLAEYDPANPKIIRVTARGIGEMILDAADPFGAGKTAGFALVGSDAKITAVKIAPDDPQAVLITCSKPPGGAVKLAYAYGAGAGQDPIRGNRGALRDGWTMDSTTGATLHRWALPALLPVTGHA